MSEPFLDREFDDYKEQREADLKDKVERLHAALRLMIPHLRYKIDHCITRKARTETAQDLKKIEELLKEIK